MGTRKLSKKEQWRQQTEAEFLKSFEEHSDPLFRHCLLRVRDREVAKDVVQETFSRCWLYVSEGKEVTHIRAFLYRIANNLIVDLSRKKRSSSLDSLMEEDGFEPRDESIREPIDTPAIKEAMNNLGKLDEMYRVVITMRFLDEMSPKEIASVLGVSENVVSVRIHRGIERLSHMMRGR